MMVPQAVPRLTLLAVLVLGAAGCDFLGPDEASGPGFLRATLVSPNGDEGSAVFELTGGVGLAEVVPVAGEVFFQHSAGSSRVVVIADEPGEVAFLVSTDDVGEPPEVQVVQVADGEDRLRGSLADYRVRLRPASRPPEEGAGG